MQPATKLPQTSNLDQDISHLKHIFASSFPVRDADQETLSEELRSEDVSQITTEEAEIDWSITLSNIRTLKERAKASEALIEAAEARASQAEEKAKKAEHWLRVLHKALLEEAPPQTVSTE